MNEYRFKELPRAVFLGKDVWTYWIRAKNVREAYQKLIKDDKQIGELYGKQWNYITKELIMYERRKA